MSSHREAPEISKDPAADNTDVYAFRSPDAPNTVTLIANYIPLQQPDGGPNFYEFADDVRYEIKISNSRQARADITYRFTFTTKVRNPDTFLYNTGPIDDIASTNWNRPQYYTVSRIEDGVVRVLARNLAVPPVNVGVRSTNDYAKLANQATHRVGGRQFFCGQRADAFHVDLGSIFDLGALRPFNENHLISMPNMNGVNSVKSYNVHSIAIQVPISDLTRNKDIPTVVRGPRSVIGVWASASRQTSRMFNKAIGKFEGTGPYAQVSRLGNPLVNEVLIPMASKEMWNSRGPRGDSVFNKYVTKPELGGLLPVLYPGVFPKLKNYDKPRADLQAILHTGIPEGVVDGFQNYTGPLQSDMLRLNVAVPPSSDPNNYGLVAGDAAGFPNGRRINDEVVNIELRAIAGVTIPLVDKSYTPDGAAGQLTDDTSQPAKQNAPLLDRFPYLGLPGGGYQTRPGTTSASGTGG